MSMQFKQVSHEIKELDDAKGVIIAYASVYNNIDSDREVIMPGAFTKTVNENYKRIRVLKDHNPTIGLGVPLAINTSDSYGLLTTTQFNLKKEVSRDMYEDIKLFLANGLNAELSIGFQTVKSIEERVDEENEIEKITEVKLWEYSFLSNWAANERALVQSVKQMNNTDFIELLVKMYNLPYSDERLKSVENILKSLETNEPIVEITPNVVEPIDNAQLLKDLLKQKGVI
jgi:HK97 family phage prohead protease